MGRNVELLYWVYTVYKHRGITAFTQPQNSHFVPVSQITPSHSSPSFVQQQTRSLLLHVNHQAKATTQFRPACFTAILYLKKALHQKLKWWKHNCFWQEQTEMYSFTHTLSFCSRFRRNKRKKKKSVWVL